MDITKQFEDRESFLAWFVIASLKGVKVDGLVAKTPRILTMQLNGIELNPEDAIKRIEEQLDQLVEEKAKELVEEARQNILEPFEKAVEEIINASKQLVEKNADTESRRKHREH